MDFSAGLFSFILVAISACIAYHWGIKPDREEKKRRAEQARAEARRRHSEELGQPPASRGKSITNKAHSGALLRRRRSN